MTLRQGDVIWALADDKCRPVLIVSRTSSIPLLNRVVVAPITKTVRGIPQEILIGASGGLGIDSVASFDNMVAIGKDRLGDRIGSVPEARHKICRALEALADC